jgi:uncharacterized alpha-E superfamily protein
MKILEQEAKEYSRNFNSCKTEETPHEFIVSMISSFVQQSKWVQAEKINAKIEGLLLANDNPSGIFYRISELEQKLKELEYEKDL